ncbi:MAG TPA: site-specific integrase [Pyrinomonadaceae bacterium]|jgi:integrase
MIERSGLTLDDFNEPGRCQEKFTAAVCKPSWTNQTIASHLLRFCAFGNWLAHQHYTHARHRPLKKLKRRPQQKEFPSDGEISGLLRILRDKYERAGRTPNRQRAYGKNYLITALLVETGARIGEISRLELQDIIERRAGKETHHAIFLRGTKSDAAERAVMIPKILYDELHRYCERWQLRGRVFLSRTGKELPERTYGHWLTHFCEELELSCHVSPHTFRYRFIVKLIAQGKSALEVMSRVGHTDVQMTVYYFNQVRRLMPWVEVNGDIALLQSRKRFWQGRRREE